MFYQFRLTATDSKLDFDIELEPARRMYCFVGENAVGKTALLESWAQVIWWIHAIWRGRRGAARSFQGWNTQKRFREAWSEQASLRVPDVEVGGARLKREGSGAWGATPMVDPVGPKDDSHQVDRPFVFVAADRRASIVNIGPEALSLVGDNISNFIKSIQRGIDTSRRRSQDLATVTTWLTSRLLVNPAFVVGMSNPQDEVIALFSLLQRFDPKAFGDAYRREGERSRIAASYQDGQVMILGRPIDRLASGWTALLKIFQEIVSTISAWEAVRGSTDILGSDALIFIDEIDAHLHPKWQARLLPFLKDAFPNATFVVTTHSALVLRDTEPGEGYELVRRDNQVSARRLGSPRDWYLSDVLADAFHVDLPLPGSEGTPGQPPLDELLLRFGRTTQEHAVVQSPELSTEALSLYDAIRARLPADDPRLTVVEQLRQLLP